MAWTVYIWYKHGASDYDRNPQTGRPRKYFDRLKAYSRKRYVEGQSSVERARVVPYPNDNRIRKGQQKLTDPMR